MHYNSSKKEEGKRYPWSVLPRTLWHFLQPFKWQFLGAHVLLLVVFFYELFPPYLLSLMINFLSTYKQGQEVSYLYWIALIFGSTWVVVAVIRLWLKRVIANMGVHMKTAARVQGFDRLLEHSLQWHMKEMAGGKVQRVLSGADALRGLLNTLSNDTFPIIAAFVGVLGVFLFLNIWYWLFLLSYTALFFLIQFTFNTKHEVLARRVGMLKEKASGVYMEQANNMLTVKAQGAQGAVADRLGTTEDEVQRLEISMNALGTGKWMFFHFLNGVALSIFLLFASLDVVRGALSVGLLVVYFNYFQQLRQAASSTSDSISQLIDQKADLGRFMELFEGHVQGKGTAAFPKQWEQLSFEGVTFAYEQGHVGVGDLTLKVGRGERLGVVGTSGGGKSTFVKLLLGLLEPQQGHISLDGLSYTHILHESLMAHVAVVLQETELFHLSFRENVTMMRPISEERLTQIIHLACLEEVVAKFPQGMETVIGEKGYFLSGGERQRIGIARALCKDADILLFDEATSALDNATEEEVLRRIFEEVQEKTIIMVAHRLSTLRFMERILVFSKGSLVEDGARQALLQTPTSIYAQLLHAGDVKKDFQEEVPQVNDEGNSK